MTSRTDVGTMVINTGLCNYLLVADAKTVNVATQLMKVGIRKFALANVSGLPN